MRIALVSPYALSAYGGVQEQTLAMSRELERRGHHVLVVAPNAKDTTTYDTPARVEVFGPLISVPANGSKAPLTFSPWAARHARAAIQKFRADLVHFHEPFAPLLGYSALRAHDVPCVATFHRSGDGPALRLTGPLLRFLANSIDVSAAVSDAAAATINRACGLNPEVLFNGFEMSRFESTPRSRSDEVVLVTLGRLEERKGVAHAVTAVRSHNAKGEEPWRLVVLGEGPERVALETLAAGDAKITFAGAPSDDQKRAWLRRANALVAPAVRGESFGLILLEGMASETSVVASDIAGYREAAGGVATLFDAGSDEKLEAAITTTLAKETPLTIAAAKSHAEHWSMTRLIDAYESLYASARERFSSSR
ncbi:MAG: glycosyltransferase family 4 protein [Acidimicrobiales bacterium]